VSNLKFVPVKSEDTEVVGDETRVIYIPLATEDSAGIIKPNKNFFEFVNGELIIKNDFLNNDFIHTDYFVLDNDKKLTVTDAFKNRIITIEGDINSNEVSISDLEGNKLDKDFSVLDPSSGLSNILLAVNEDGNIKSLPLDTIISNLVTSVNGEKGDVNITPESIGTIKYLEDGTNLETVEDGYYLLKAGYSYIGDIYVGERPTHGWVRKSTTTTGWNKIYLSAWYDPNQFYETGNDDHTMSYIFVKDNKLGTWTDYSPVHYTYNSDGNIDIKWELFGTSSTNYRNKLNLSDSFLQRITDIENNKLEVSDIEDKMSKIDYLDVNDKIKLDKLPDLTKQPALVFSTTVAFNNYDTSGLVEGSKAFDNEAKTSYIWDGTQWLLTSDADWANVNLDWGNITNSPTNNAEETLSGKKVYDTTEADNKISEHNTDETSHDDIRVELANKADQSDFDNLSPEVNSFLNTNTYFDGETFTDRDILLLAKNPDNYGKRFYLKPGVDYKNDPMTSFGDLNRDRIRYVDVMRYHSNTDKVYIFYRQEFSLTGIHNGENKSTLKSLKAIYTISTDSFSSGEGGLPTSSIYGGLLEIWFKDGLNPSVELENHNTDETAHDDIREQIDSSVLNGTLNYLPEDTDILDLVLDSNNYGKTFYLKPDVGYPNEPYGGNIDGGYEKIPRFLTIQSIDYGASFKKVYLRYNIVFASKSEMGLNLPNYEDGSNMFFPTNVLIATYDLVTENFETTTTSPLYSGWSHMGIPDIWKGDSEREIMFGKTIKQNNEYGVKLWDVDTDWLDNNYLPKTATFTLSSANWSTNEYTLSLVGSDLEDLDNLIVDITSDTIQDLIDYGLYIKSVSLNQIVIASQNDAPTTDIDIKIIYQKESA